MKLLFDANLSPDLPRRLDDIYPNSGNVYSFGLEFSDTAVWDHAKAEGLMIVSKDSDFKQRALVIGAPPKVVWIRLGNCRTGVVESLLRQRLDQIRQFFNDPNESLLALP